MKNYDVMIIGPATRDCNIDYDGAVNHCVGGAVTFCTPAAASTGARVFAAVKANQNDTDILDAFVMDKDDVALLPSTDTTLMRNEYFTADRERRKGTCTAQSDPITAAEIPNVTCGLYHLAGLLYGDFPGELIEGLAARGKVSANIQAFLRHNENGNMVFHDWTDKIKYFPYFDFLKTDTAEAEILTGLTDRYEAARVMHGWGAKEILISNNAEMLVYDGKDFYACPVRARNLSGRTGRGETTFGAYIAMRMLGNDIKTSLLYATACVSLKMETPGAFRGTRADVAAYIDTFFADQK